LQGILTISDGADSARKQRLLQTDARFEQQLANSQEAFEQPVLNSVAGYEQQKASSEVQLLNSRARESEQQVAATNSWGAGSEQRQATNSWAGEAEQQVAAANSWEAGSEQRQATNSWGAGSEQRLATNSWGAGSLQRQATNSWGAGSEQRQATNSWGAGSEQRQATNSWARESEQRAVVENSQPEVSEQRSGSMPNSRPGYELVETVEATQDLAEQLSSLCARFCGSGRRWLPGRPRSGARRRPANQRMVIRKESQKYQMHQGQQLSLGANIKDYKVTYRFPDNTSICLVRYQDKMYLDKTHRGFNPLVTSSSAAETYGRLIHI
jgi:hypothetical protein